MKLLWRYVLAWMGCLGIMNVYFCRINLSVAMVAMVGVEQVPADNVTETSSTCKARWHHTVTESRRRWLCCWWKWLFGVVAIGVDHENLQWPLVMKSFDWVAPLLYCRGGGAGREGQEGEFKWSKQQQVDYFCHHFVLFICHFLSLVQTVTGLGDRLLLLVLCCLSNTSSLARYQVWISSRLWFFDAGRRVVVGKRLDADHLHPCPMPT